MVQKPNIQHFCQRALSTMLGLVVLAGVHGQQSDLLSTSLIKSMTADSSHSKSQFAIWPGLGTLGKADKDSRTDYSFFLFGGRSLENRKLSIAGIFAATGSFQGGLQLSGLANINRGLGQGVQIAGLYNQADTLLGMQLGLFNYADTVAGGLPIGVLTYVKNGYHRAEISFDESFRLNVSFQTGVQLLHNILAFGYGQRNEGLQVWYVGYGLGSAPKLGERTALHVQLISMWLHNADPPTFNLLNRLAFGVEYRIGTRVSVYGGAQISGLIYETATAFPAYILPQRREPVYREAFGDGYTLHIYPGARLGLRVHW